MSGVTAAGVLAAAAVAGTAYSIYNGQQQASAQKDAAQKAQQNAAQQADQADQANNRANAKSPDVGAMLSANQQAAKGGMSGTMLTGPTGVDPSQLSLGKSTLLGQ
ncbi:hypothetical protein JK151_08905 [Ralstonia syzygii subsp. celebesensis]|uniref:Uncharacterized protein n=2 Tax=Ralstonia syzygii subsp. celebesensis TaxID=1310168 RepID=A0A1U9VEL6_9RALS|nr:hypothetical protein [Ralstonia syzygii]AQW29118.1 hypothetical protein B0B51_03215 [blood disease bacterium A2-HR MARDI]QQV54339.1 hypothetical protein JK151_08905 [Ralstonia syzygii subsp. celebesensis]CCA79410.1 putative phage protein p22 [blood disease bacterium R229]